MTPMAAALASAREVGFTVLSMSLSLIAVFIPILFMGDIVGRFFREFAMTLSVAILISLAVSLTLTPMMCARLLEREAEPAGKNVFARLSEKTFGGIQKAYAWTLAWALRHPLVMVATLVAAVGLNVYLYYAIPKGFFPQQDTGRLIGFIRGDQTTSFQAMQQKMTQIVDLVRADPAVESVTAVTGGAFGARNFGFMTIALKPRAEREPAGDV